MNNLTSIPVINGKVSCERCGLPVLRNVKTQTFSGCDHFIRMDLDSSCGIFANYSEDERD